MAKEYTITLLAEYVNTVIIALGELPLKQAIGVFSEVQKQCTAIEKEENKATADLPTLTDVVTVAPISN